MKRCRYCKTDVDTDKNFCPVCFNRLESIDDKSTGMYPLRKSNETTIKNSKFLYKLFLFITVCSITSCVLVNVLLTHEPYWFWIVVFGEVYLWITVTHTILSGGSVFSKIFLQIVFILLILFFAERLSISNWLLPYVFPSISLCALFVLALILFISNKRGEYVFGFTVLVTILGTVSVLLIVLKLTAGFDILNVINIAACGLSFFGYLLFGFTAMKNDLSKRWHL